MKESKTVNILFCGIGGQGVLTASEVCARAAILQGYHVKKSEVHGMAQRGGSVESHLRFAKEVLSPLIPFGQADYLVPFFIGEHARLRKFLKPLGVDLISCLSKAEDILPDKRYLNTFLIGNLARYLTIDEENWLKALRVVFADKNLEENKKIFLKAKGAQP